MTEPHSQIGGKRNQTLVPTTNGPGKLTLSSVSPAKTALNKLRTVSKDYKIDLSTYDRLKPSGAISLLTMYMSAVGPILTPLT